MNTIVNEVMRNSIENGVQTTEKLIEAKSLTQQMLKLTKRDLDKLVGMEERLGGEMTDQALFNTTIRGPARRCHPRN